MIHSIIAIPAKSILIAGETSFITMRYFSSCVILPEIHWESSHPDIVTIDEYGTEIHAKRPGTALINCTFLDGSANIISYEITVIDSFDMLFQ